LHSRGKRGRKRRECKFQHTSRPSLEISAYKFQDGKNVRVTLFPENNEQGIPLRPYDEKSWDTADQISPLKKRQMISDFVANVLGTVAGAVIQSQLG